MCRRTVVLICLLLSVSARMGAQESAPIDFETARFERRLTAKRTAGAIVIDGRLDEADWRNAPLATDFLQNDPREGEPASAATEVRVLYDDENLYFGAIAYDAEPDKLVINDLTRDFNARAGDSFGIVLDTFHDERNGYMFQTNPAGAKFDAQFINEGREFNMNWDGVWYAESRVTELGWITEIAIPFKTLRFNDAAPQVWGINFLRCNRRLNENSYWAPLPRIHNFARVSLAGTLQGLSGLKRQRDIKVTPYAKGDVLQDADVATSTHFDGGLDAKLAIGSGLRLDLTLNTDFSQVEADVQQINLTRFSLLFPEKRDFFLENSGIFRFGPPTDPRVSQFQASFGSVASPSNLRGGQARGDDMFFFFSRRIGLSEEGVPIPVIGGGRLTGRVGQYDVGFLNMQTGEASGLTGDSLSANGDNFTVARVRRNIFGHSDIGVMFLNRTNMNTDHYNRGFGIDGNFRISPEIDINAYIAKTSTKGLSGDDYAGPARLDLRQPLVAASKRDLHAPRQLQPGNGFRAAYWGEAKQQSHRLPSPPRVVARFSARDQPAFRVRVFRRPRKRGGQPIPQRACFPPNAKWRVLRVRLEHEFGATAGRLSHPPRCDDPSGVLHVQRDLRDGLHGSEPDVLGQCARLDGRLLLWHSGSRLTRRRGEARCKDLGEIRLVL